MKSKQRMVSRVGLEGANWPIMVLGLAMIILGAMGPGTQAEAVSVLIVVGSGMVVTGAMAPRFGELEIGPGKLKWTKAEGSTPQPWLATEAETLYRISVGVLGEGELSRDVVEDTLAKVRRYSARIPADRRDSTTLKTLVALLDRADQRRWLSGPSSDLTQRNVVSALQRLEFSVRIAYALRQEFPAREVAEILGRSEVSILNDVDHAHEILRPYVERETSPESG